ncbi:hypothetical protein ACP3V3_16960 [Vibrio sp. PNB22_3_1]
MLKEQTGYMKHRPPAHTFVDIEDAAKYGSIELDDIEQDINEDTAPTDSFVGAIYLAFILFIALISGIGNFINYISNLF